MILFGDNKNKPLSEGIASCLSSELFYPDVTVFSDGERRVRTNENVVDQDVVFLKTASITPNVDSVVVETAFLIDCFKRSGAKSITGVIPYVAYSRADHVFRDGEAVPLEVVIHMFEKAGLSRIVFVDPHTIKMSEMFNIDVSNVSALPLFAQKIREIGFDFDNSVIVSPDMGGLRRMEQMSHLLDGLPYVSIEKERDYENGSISASAVHGQIKKTCFIIDDIISSGRTIVQAVEKLKEHGAERIYVFATHPIFAGDATNILEDCGVERIFVTDSLPLSHEKQFPRLEILSLAPLLSESFLK